MSPASAAGDEQDFDALSESSFDYGHFHELDSDVEEPEVEDQSLDPFTAAQREEAAAQQLSGSTYDANKDEDHEDQFSFTQKLLTNARTLKQLQESGAPEIEIGYEEELTSSQPGAADEPATEKDNTPAVSSQAQHRPRILSFSSSSYTQPSQGPEPSQRRHSYHFDERKYASILNASLEESISGKFESFPAYVLKGFSFDQCRLILEQTKRYGVRPSDTTSDEVCLTDLWRGAEQLDVLPLFKIVEINGNRAILEDVHAERDPCSVLAICTDVEELVVTEPSSLAISQFYFDHAASLGKVRKSGKRVTIQEEVDESFYSSSQQQNVDSAAESMLGVANQEARKDATPIRSTMKQGSSGEATTASVSVLVVTQHTLVSQEAWRGTKQSRLESRRDAQRLFESDPPSQQGPTQDTIETNYSDQFEGNLDINDFPVEDLEQRIRDE